MLSDVCNSIQFLFWREEDRSLTLISRDYDRCVCLSTSFIFDGNKLAMLLSDDEGNIELLQFNPKKIESRRGTRLLCLADFHIGSDVTLMLPHQALTAPSIAGHIHTGLLIDAGNQSGRVSYEMRNRKQFTPNTVAFGTRLEKTGVSRTVTVVGTMNGSVGVLVPIDERLYRRLALLQQIMSIGVQTPCALNPREYRIIKTSRFKVDKKRGILDGNLLWKFVTLETSLQNSLAAAMGITTDIIMESLQEIDLVTNFF